MKTLGGWDVLDITETGIIPTNLDEAREYLIAHGVSGKVRSLCGAVGKYASVTVMPCGPLDELTTPRDHRVEYFIHKPGQGFDFFTI